MCIGTTTSSVMAASFVPYYSGYRTFSTAASNTTTTTSPSVPLVSNPSANNSSGSVTSSNNTSNTTTTASNFIPFGYRQWNTSTVTTPTPAPTPTPSPAPTPAPTPTPSPAPTPAPTPTTPSVINLNPLPTSLTAKEQQLVDLVNQERTSRGLKPLEVDMRLVKLARMKSQDMIDNNYTDHISPTYGSPFDMMKNAGISFNTAAENIAGASTVATIHQNLMNSPGHRANILSTSFTKIGIGIIEGGPYGLMVSQEFIG